MKKFSVIFFWLLFCLFHFSSYCYAGANLISYQGMLNDASGNPVNNTSLEMTFSIYDSGSGGTAQWSEVQTVQVSDGLFNVRLGTVQPLTSSVLKGETLYLGVKVGSDSEMTPRQRITSGAHAYWAEEVEHEEVPVGTITNWLKTTESLYSGNVTGCTNKTLIDGTASFQSDAAGKSCMISYPTDPLEAIFSDDHILGLLVDSVTLRTACSGQCEAFLYFYYADGTQFEHNIGESNSTWQERTRNNPNPAKPVWKVSIQQGSLSISDRTINFSPNEKLWAKISSVDSSTQVSFQEATAISTQCSYTIGRTPPLSSDWVEMNGQTLLDDESVYNNYVIPNLNGTNPCPISGMVWIMRVK